MNALGRNIMVATLLLGAFALAGTSLVSFTYQQTREQILENERAALLRNLHAIIPPGRHDNDIFSDRIQVSSPDLLNSSEPVTVYRARKAGKPVALALTSIAPDGYNGKIKILVGINADGSVAGVRVIAHRETPGLGDAIESEKSDWVKGFNGASLNNTSKKQWTVKKDGGRFDQFTGATITPRAVTRAIHRSLLYYQQNRKMLFATPSQHK